MTQQLGIDRYDAKFREAFIEKMNKDGTNDITFKEFDKFMTKYYEKKDKEFKNIDKGSDSGSDSDKKKDKKKDKDSGSDSDKKKDKKKK